MAKRKQQMPAFYGKNIAQHAQRRFLKRWKAEHRKKSAPDVISDDLHRMPDQAQQDRREE